MVEVSTLLFLLFCQRLSMRSQQNPRQRSHHFQLHFSVALDVLLICCGLFVLSILLPLLPHTFPNLSSFSYTSIVVSMWNLGSLVAVAATLWTVIFLPLNEVNRRWAKTWLILLLSAQVILILLPGRQDLVTLASFFTPAWIVIATFIRLLHVEPRIMKSGGFALADSWPKRPVKERLIKGFKKLFLAPAVPFFLAVLVMTGIVLADEFGRSIASRSWPVAQAELIRCETAEGTEAIWNSCFHLEYSFEVQGTSYSGDDYGLITDKPTAICFNEADEVVEQIKSTEALQVSYNPKNPSQNLIAPRANSSFALMVVPTIIHGLFYLFLIRYFWSYLATSRFTDPESVYRVSSRYRGFFDILIIMMFIGLVGFGLMAPFVPISTELCAALMLWLAIAGSYSFHARCIKEQKEKIAEQVEAGKTIVYGYNPA